MSAPVGLTLPATPETVERWLEDGDFPRIDGDRVTFAWRGEADAVHLRCWASLIIEAMPFQRIEGTDVWIYSLELPHASRVEYKFKVERGDEVQWLRDPLNPELAHDPFGANSVCQCSGYAVPAWVRPDPQARTGRYVPLVVHSEAFGEARPLRVYLPARYSENRAYPLLIVHDGADYIRYSAFGTVLDNLIHLLETPSMIVAFTTSPDRLVEYAADDRHAKFVAEEIPQAIAERFKISDRAEDRALIGASFGAVAALHAAWKYPGVFGSLMLQSGSFAFTDIGTHDRGPAFDRVVDWVNEFRERPGKPADRVFMSCGTYETLIYENRSMVPRLQAAGMDVRFVESRDSHNWENWRDQLRYGLAWVYPGPLWMVYE